MVKKALIWVILCILTLNMAFACFDPSYKYKFLVQKDFDVNKLFDIINGETGTYILNNDDEIIIKSFAKDQLTVTFKSQKVKNCFQISEKENATKNGLVCDSNLIEKDLIIFTLPYIKTEKLLPLPTYNTFDFKNSVKVNLYNLQSLGIIKISSEDINKIDELVSPGEKVIFYNNEWMQINQNCYEKEGNISCVSCPEETSYDYVPSFKSPNNWLDYEKIRKKMESGFIVWYLILMLILLGSIAYLYKKNNKSI